MLLRVRPYEVEPGAAKALYDRWDAVCQEFLQYGGYSPTLGRNLGYLGLIKRIVAAFDELPLQQVPRKPRVGIVGEILVKYHPTANNQVERVLMEEGAEVVMPDFVNFLLYLAYCSVGEHRLLEDTLMHSLLAQGFIQIMELLRRPMRKALAASKRFEPPHSIRHIAELARKHVSLGNIAGEGWFLTGEMVELLDEGVNNIVCLQPFACLPNHITGKGVIHELRESNPGCNILALDCDAGSSEVNQLNRLKLMLSVASRTDADRATA